MYVLIKEQQERNATQQNYKLFEDKNRKRETSKQHLEGK